MTDIDAKGYYDDFSGWYERKRHHGYHAMLDDLELGIVRGLAGGREVLEVGCGTGLIMRGLDGRAKRLVGVDISPGMLAEARRRGFEVLEGRAEKLPFADESFDLAYSFKVLAHVPEIELALREMARVLRPGGYLVAEFYNALSLRRLAKRLGGPGKISDDRTEAEMFTRWDTPRQIMSYLPPGLVFEGWRGVRVLTPVAFVHDIPLVGGLVARAERTAMRSPLARFGGFLVAVCRKA
jgi:ubiquinone/menaquinone biosynthesis C-methylase UbiE